MEESRFYFSEVRDFRTWESDHYFVFAKNGSGAAAEGFLTEFNRLKAVEAIAKELAEIPVVDFSSQRAKLAELRTLLKG